MTRSLSGRPNTFWIALAFFFFSSGAVLYSLAIFRLLSFFVMPSIFFDLLLVGFPLGAAIAVRWLGSEPSDLSRLLGVLQGVMAVTVLASLLCKHVGYMRAQLLGISPLWLLVQIFVFSAIYLPFFLAYGAAEYVGYLIGARAFSSRMRAGYAVFLFGGAAAFALAHLLGSALGVPRILLVALSMVALSQALIGVVRVGPWASTALWVALCAWPQWDNVFMAFFKSSAMMSTAHRLAGSGGQIVYSRWGKFGYFEVLARRSRDELELFGFYNDVNMWAGMPGNGPNDALPALLLEPGNRVAVIGSGGGREVRAAYEAGIRDIVAIEIEPRVVEAIRGELRDLFQGVYDLPGVRVVVGEARRWMEQTTERFDLIQMMSVGGYPQMMLEPGNMIRTGDAYRVFASRLTDNGVLAISYDARLDSEGVLLTQYFRTFLLLGYPCKAYYLAGLDGYLLLVFNPRASTQQRERWNQSFAQLRNLGAAELPSDYMMRADFRLITDDRPYFAGNIRTILSLHQIGLLAAVLGGILCVVGGIVAEVCLRSLRKALRPDLSVHGLVWVSFLVGANFVTLEHACVIELFRRTYVYYDALVVGIIGFLAVTGTGSLLLHPRSVTGLLLVGGAFLAAWLWRLYDSPNWLAGLALVPAVLVTGALFPRIFDVAGPGRLQVFAMDAVGAAAGALVSFFVPMAFGFRLFAAVAVLLFMATGVTVMLFLKGVSRAVADYGSQ